MEQSKPKKKRKTREPSIRLKKALKDMVENGSKAGPALRRAGYSEAIASVPSKIMQSPTAQAYLEKLGISDDMISAALKRNLNAKRPSSRTFHATEMSLEEVQKLFDDEDIKVINIREKFNDDQERSVVVDFWADVSDPQCRALDMILKTKGAYNDQPDPSSAASLLSLRAAMDQAGLEVVAVHKLP